MKFRTRKFGDIRETGQYLVLEHEDFEYVNPVDQIMAMFISTSMSFEKEFLVSNGIKITKDTMDDIFRNAIREWAIKYEKYKSITLPKNLLKLLETEIKKEQISLLKGISLTTDELTAFIIRANLDYGYTYSQYKAYHNHEGLDETLLPEIIHIEENNKVKTLGETTLTNGQLRQVIEHRKVIVSKFLDKNKLWHCFFLTYKSLSGKEQYKDGQPHFHYISSAWNLSRQDVKEQLTNKKYSLPSLPHIDFNRN